MTEITGSFDAFSGLEKMNYARFVMTHTIRRPAQAPMKVDDWNTLQLPTGSVLHTVNGFETLEPPAGGMPDTTIPLVVNETLPVYLRVNTLPANQASRPFGVSESYSYKPNALSSQINHFYQSNRKYHKVLSDRILGTMTNCMAWVDYSPLTEIRTVGSIHAYRKFDIIFRTILDMITKIGANRHHYILLPQSDKVFSRAALQRSFKELTTTSLNTFADDPSIFPIIHILGYIFGKTKDIAPKPYKEDVKILGKDDASFSEMHSTSLIERIPADMFSAINFVFQRGNKVVVYNLADLAGFAEDGAFYTKFFRHIMMLRLSSAQMPMQMDADSEQFDTFVSDRAQDEPAPPVAPDLVAADPDTTTVAVGQPVMTPTSLVLNVKHVETVDQTPQVVAPQTFETRLREEVVRQSAAAVSVEPKKESRRNTLLDNHLKVTINGKSLGELIQPLPTQVVTPKNMPYIKSAPEPSYQQSSLLSMDRTYHEHAYHQEMAKVVGSLAKHGMFITKVEEEHNHTEMDRTTTYKLSLSDLAGKSHAVKFTIPDVDENGMMKLSGTEYRLTRQIANVPICKVAPHRVNLSSYYNKVIIERIQSKRFSYANDVEKMLMDLKSQGLVEATSGATPMPTTKVPYDYTAVGRNITDARFNGYHITFDNESATWDSLDDNAKEAMTAQQVEAGTIVGSGPGGSVLVWNLDNSISAIRNQTVVSSWTSFHAMLANVVGDAARTDKTPVEWTTAKIINQNIPLVYILAYKFGLKAVLDMIRLDYKFYASKSDFDAGIDDLVVPLLDGTLVFNRYPLARSLIAAGLLWTDLSKFSFGDLGVPSTYAKVFAQKRMSVGVLKGLDGFFDFFVDPMTETVLEKMGEPITFHELLLRANVMLTDYHAVESSSVGLHRFRMYERFNGMIYNELFREFAAYRNNPSSKKSFSVNPQAVFQKIVQDATISPNEVINPVHEVKQRANITYTGSGGRAPRGLVIKDLIYPKDGLGVISDAVPDSGKVGITAYLSASPNISDIHGIPKAYKDGDVLEPPQILSIGSMVMPGGTTDDGKRNSYLSIQISHYVPNHNDGETLAVRTGYDEVLPHLSSNVFAVTADDNGIVESVDEKQRVLTVRYADKPVVSLRAIKIPYLEGVIDGFRRNGTSFGFLIADTDVGDYPMGGTFALTKSTYGKVVDRLRCETVDAIPDKDVARKQNTLVQEFVRGKHKSLYYVRFTPLGSTVPGTVKSYSYADIYSQNSGSYLLQKRVANVKPGERFKYGDILVYNPGFFVPDPMSKQVTFKHGVIATVALVEKSSNHEDACEISRDLSERMKMTPCHQREVVTNNDAVILNMVRVSDHVETPDALCVIADEFLIGTSLNTNSENIDIIEQLNRQTPSAGYTGTIRKIRILYGCDREKLSDSLKAILKVYEKEVRDNFKALNTDLSIKPPEKPGWVAPGTKYKGVDFTDTTVILEFMIEETLNVLEGDKVCFANANKSIAAHVAEKQHYTESGIPVDALFSTTSIINRIVKSPFNGIAERNMDALKTQALEMYFGKS